MLEALKNADAGAQTPFGKNTEESIISLALDIPQYVEPVLQYLTPEHFSRTETQYIYANIAKIYENHNVIPTRQLLRDVISKQLTVDDPYEQILEIIDKPSDPREVPVIKEQLKSWAQKQAYGLIYSEEAQEAYYRGDYTFIEGIIEKAQKIQEVNSTGFWFYDQIDELFAENSVEHIPTGFPRLDKLLNDGGPSRGEVLCYMAATNVGKCATDQTYIIEEKLSRIYALKHADGSTRSYAGFRGINTCRGLIKVCDLSRTDEIIDMPPEQDAADIHLDVSIIKADHGLINPTDGFKHIRFKEIFNRDDCRVLTPTGFADVLACEKIKTGPTKIVSLSNGMQLVCDPKHRVKTHGKGEEVCVQDLKDNDRLIGYDGSPISFTISDGPVEDLYDVELPNPHWWYTAGVESHNSILLCNSAITSLKAGYDTMLVTFEMSSVKTAMRCLGSLTGYDLVNMKEHEASVKQTLKRMAGSSTARLGIFELPPDECSVNHIYQILTSLKRSKGWAPKVVIIDYLELMMSRYKHYNKEEYLRQKHVATEVRGLAINEKVLVTTATQTNRSSVGSSELVDLNKAAESFGKSMPLDYIVSLNQTPDEHKPLDGSIPKIRMFIAKNRNGPKHEMISCSINYNNMQVRESK